MYNWLITCLDRDGQTTSALKRGTGGVGPIDLLRDELCRNLHIYILYVKSFRDTKQNSFLRFTQKRVKHYYSTTKARASTGILLACSDFSDMD